MRELPLDHYGLIGNCATVALVGRDGSIDWCCLPDLDRPSTFAALLDPVQGGRFRVAPAGASEGRQRYVEGTNVLETRFDCGAGALVVTDFLPVEGDLRRVATRLPASLRALLERPRLHRMLRAEHADATVSVEWSPRYD
jgi:GH15 family glucan-1,4-alpha-glucosidase